MNLKGGGNPLDYAVGIYGTLEQAHADMEKQNKFLEFLIALPIIKHLVLRGRHVLFAKLFWSNQSDDWEERLKQDEKASLPDPKTGKFDMNRYKYDPQSRWVTDPGTGEKKKASYVNFDYGFRDESTKSFRHSNHMQ